jgi:hypothetical protein
MRKLIGALIFAGMLVLPAVPAQAQEIVPRHVHQLTTPNGTTHAIAGGLTSNAPCTAFLNFHEIVHETVFGTPGTGTLKNPNGPLTAAPATGSCIVEE